jgi:hypothetical protein
MRDLLTIADRMDEIAREIPVSSYAGFLEEANYKIKKIAAKNAFYIDVYHSENISPFVKKFITTLNESVNDSNFVLYYKNEKTFDIKVFEDIFPSVAVVFLDETTQNSEILINHLKKYDSLYKVIVAINLELDEVDERGLGRIFGFGKKVISLKPEAFTGKSFEEILSEFIEPKMFESLKKLSYLNSIKPVFSFLDDIIAAENKAAGTRKLLNNQNVSITRKEEQLSNISDLSGILRQITQKDIQDLEKNYKTKYDDLNKPNIGAFSINLKNEVDQLVEFEKQTVAEKSEKVDISINADFQEKFVKNIRRHLSGEYEKDASFVKSSLDDLIKKINIQLKSKGIAPISAEEVYPPFPEGKRVLDSYCYISKEYKGELMKKGITEYFVALRDYTGIIMVAVGLLGPLNGITMMSEFFEKDKTGAQPGAAESFVNIFKGFNASIKILTAVITLAMIVYGIIDLRQRIPRRRVEEWNREMNKAKDSLTQEGKRIYSEGSKDWLQNISGWIRDVSQNISLQIEKNLKNTQLARLSQNNNEKLQQQKQLQVVDMLVSSIQSAGRIKDQTATRYRDAVAEIEKEIKF